VLIIDPEVLMRGGLVHLPGVVDAAIRTSVVDAIWDHLAARGVRRFDQTTWPRGAVSGLQSLKRDGALRALATQEILTIRSQILRSEASFPAMEWAPLIRFPEPGGPWRVPHKVWHLDEPGRGSPSTHRTSRLFVILSDLQQRGGATLAVEGSAALVRRIVADSPNHDAGSSTAVRKTLRQRYEWFELLMSERAPIGDARLREGEEVDGVFCSVKEMTGAAGDVWCIDQWTLHNGSTNARDRPRLAATLFSGV
jgi:hypothetical protein